MFSLKKNTAKKTPVNLDDHPHLKSMALWNDLYGNAEKRYRQSKVVIFCLLGLLSIAVIGLISIGSKSKFEPWLVALEGNTAINVGALSKQSMTDLQKKTLSEFFLKEFIESARSVSVDGDVDKQKIAKAMSFVGQSAFARLKDYLDENNKYDIAADKTVSIDKFSYVLQVSPSTYKAKWLEVVRDSSTGRLLEEKHMVGEFQFAWGEPSKNTYIFENNPLGFFIENFSWIGEK